MFSFTVPNKDEFHTHPSSHYKILLHISSLFHPLFLLYETSICKKYLTQRIGKHYNYMCKILFTRERRNMHMKWLTILIGMIIWGIYKRIFLAVIKLLTLGLQMMNAKQKLSKRQSLQAGPVFLCFVPLIS